MDSKLKSTWNKNITLISIATAFISFSLMVFEIAITRIFSVMLSYHYVFLILSMAILGIGVGAFFLGKIKKRFSGNDYRYNALFSALSIALILLFILVVPIYKISFLQGSLVWIYILISAIPFMFFGLTLAEIFQSNAERSSLIYGFDLVGAALGTLSVVPLLDLTGPVNLVMIAALITALSSLILFIQKGMGKNILFGLVSFLFLLLLLPIANLLEVPVTPDVNKDMVRVLNNPYEQPEIVESRWSSFGRTDLLKSKSDSDQMSMFIDGAAGTPMFNYQSLINDPQKLMHFKNHFSGFFPLLFMKENEKDSALIIGPGGGRDVIVAKLGGVKNIIAVEVNPDFVNIVKDYEEFNGGIYSTMPGISVVVHEGRNFVKKSKDKYDLITLAIPITKSSRSVEGYALTENYLFTVESFSDYLDHLTAEGSIIIVAHNDTEIYRLISLTLLAFKERGITESEAMNHIYTIGSDMMPAIVIKKKPFDEEQSKVIHLAMHKMGFDKGSYFIPFNEQIIVRPGEGYDIDKPWYMFDKILVDISKDSLQISGLINAAQLDISPVYDDSPFFYKFEFDIPSPFGLFSFLISLGIVILFLIVFKKTHTGIFGKYADKPKLKFFVFIFSILGMGFMLFEIAFLQKLNLYIGQPVIALSVLLFSLLLGTGLGSLASGLVKRKLLPAIIVSTIIIAVLTLFYNAWLPGYLSASQNINLAAYSTLIPLGFFLGFPFPLSIRLMKRLNLGDEIDTMWGVNGVASVAGSTLTIIIGMLYGFSYAILMGAIIYSIIGVSGFLILRVNKSFIFAETIK